MAKKKRSAKERKKGVKKVSMKTAVKASNNSRPDMGIAILALIVNLLIPGIGSMIGGKVNTGIWQLVLLIVGAFLSIILIGIPLVIAAWIWALVTSIKIIQRAN
jgi:TM2 domain-containing membrane protein YozV